MKKLIPMLVLGTFLAGCQQQTKEAEKTNPQTDIEKQSYALGAMSGQQLASDDTIKSLNLDNKMLAAGFRDGLMGEQALTEEQIQEEFAKFRETAQQKQLEQQQKQQEEIAANAQTEKNAGAAYVEEQKSSDDTIVTTESGLSYKVLEESGNEEKPAATDTVLVHYTGTLIDGTVFDSSVERGEPITFPLNRVISGWTEGVQLMSKGDKYRFYIPSELAYGDQGRPSIPGGATLIFDVELLDINPEANSQEKTEDS